MSPLFNLLLVLLCIKWSHTEWTLTENVALYSIYVSWLNLSQMHLMIEHLMIEEEGIKITWNILKEKILH